MANWTYRCYDDGKSPNLWERWYRDYPPARGAHNAAFEMLEGMERWSLPNWKPLGGRYAGLSEIRFKGRDNRQWRVFGEVDHQNQVFTTLSIGYHKGTNYTPGNVMAKGYQRMKDVQSDRTKAKVCERPGKETD